MENYHLPFPVIAIEDAADRHSPANRCVLLSVECAEARRFQFFAGESTKADDCYAAGTLLALPGEWSSIKQDNLMTFLTLRMWKGDKKSGLKEIASPLNLLGAERDDDEIERITERIHSQEISFAEACRMKGKLESHIDKFMVTVMHATCVIGILSVLIINEPSRFIVEERSLNARSESRLTIRRSADRPHFIVLKPRQIRERFLWPDKTKDEKEDSEEDERRKVTPHERRGHFRTLHSERFVNARGQVIWIKPCWIGPEEATKNGNRYKVRLDL